MNKQPMYTTTVNTMDKKIIEKHSPHFDTEIFLHTYDSSNRLTKTISKNKNGKIESISEIIYHCNEDNDVIKRIHTDKNFSTTVPEEFRLHSFEIDYEYEYLPTGEKSKQIQKRDGLDFYSKHYQYINGKLSKIETFAKSDSNSPFVKQKNELFDYSNANFVLKTVTLPCDTVSYYKMYFLDDGKIVSAIKLNPQKGKMRWSIDNVDINETWTSFIIYIFEDLLYPSFLIEILDYLLGLEHHGRRVSIYAYEVYTDHQFFPQNADIIEKYKEIYGINFNWTF
ncbi:MAG: hypothetical protein FWG64_12220 [Firmicutes bacterium]|nr:hypothetical protein [Bacillota bacterium]